MQVYIASTVRDTNDDIVVYRIMMDKISKQTSLILEIGY